MLREVGFETFGKFAPCKHNTPPTPFAFESDIRAQTRDSPFIGTTRMLFAEPQVVIESQVGEHYLPGLRKSLDGLLIETNYFRLPKSFDVNIIN
jgi:hypothetical protein